MVVRRAPTSLLIIVISLLCLVGTAASQETPVGGLDREMMAKGLTDIQSLDSEIRVELKYATTDNFLHADVYGDLEHCYLQKAVAEKLVAAQKALRKQKDGWSLLLYDCVRPRRVQLRMWNLVKGTEQQRYVAPPRSGSIHNYGAAVDLTIVDAAGQPLDMGTPYDFFGDLAQPQYEAKFLKEGKLSPAQIENRRLLRQVMRATGFISRLDEWWHFNGFWKEEIEARYQIIE
jgi:D-alanyl-D-alanine dipeptidase